LVDESEKKEGTYKEISVLFDKHNGKSSVKIPVIKHERIKDFLIPILRKIPKDKRSIDFFGKITKKN